MHPRLTIDLSVTRKTASERPIFMSSRWQADPSRSPRFTRWQRPLGTKRKARVASAAGRSRASPYAVTVRNHRNVVRNPLGMSIRKCVESADNFLRIATHIANRGLNIAVNGGDMSH
jgi:hypothetical protein